MEYELVYALPDSYAKPVRYRERQFPTNTWRLFALTEEQMQQFQEDVQAQQRQLDLEQCKGAALDALGQMYSCIRGAGESDDRYRMALLCRIGSCFGDGGFRVDGSVQLLRLCAGDTLLSGSWHSVGTAARRKRCGAAKAAGVAVRAAGDDRQPFGGRRGARTGGACGQFVLLLRRWRRTERCL